jgi:hypothetical protein
VNLPASAITCSTSITMPALPPAPVVNPTTIYWTQPELPGQVCKADLTLVNTWLTLVVPPAVYGSTYSTGLVATNEAGAGPRSSASNPFVRVNPPSPLATVRVNKQ